MKTKRSTPLSLNRLMLLLVLLIGSYQLGQSQTINVNGQTLAPQGQNSTGTAVASEGRDTVPTGGNVRYYVVPDASANASYTGILTGSLSSNFKWDVASKTGTADTITTGRAINYVGSYTSFSNYMNVSWKGIGTLDLSYVERSAAGCSGTPKTLPISIIATPTVEFFNMSDTALCTPGTDGSLGLTKTDIRIRYSSSISGLSTRNLIVTYDIARPAAAGGNLTGQTATLTIENGTTAKLSLPAGALNWYGQYTITLTNITDRISRKSVPAAAGSLADIDAAVGVKSSYQIMVNPVPTTGTIYHLPNM